jgi:YesN/AraC family two-component response regulator
MLRTSLPTVSPDISLMRQIVTRYEFGTALIEAVKQGNSSLAFHILGQYTPGSENTMRNPNPMRNAQNYCIVFNTQLRQAMEQCGIHPYRVEKLSNEIGSQIEQLTELSKLKDFIKFMIRQYCRLVQKHTYPNLDPLTNLAVEYIKEHLSDNLSVKETARALTINADYLSAQFHRHMNISFIDFVNQERVKQAGALLVSTHLQIQQISQIVGYNNTSYFAKQFSRYMGVSPRTYRQQHFPKT